MRVYQAALTIFECAGIVEPPVAAPVLQSIRKRWEDLRQDVVNVIGHRSDAFDIQVAEVYRQHSDLSRAPVRTIGPNEIRAQYIWAWKTYEIK
jgi:hypothetical protein